MGSRVSKISYHPELHPFSPFCSLPYPQAFFEGLPSNLCSNNSFHRYRPHDLASYYFGGKWGSPFIVSTEEREIPKLLYISPVLVGHPHLPMNKRIKSIDWSLQDCYPITGSGHFSQNTWNQNWEGPVSQRRTEDAINMEKGAWRPPNYKHPI